MKRLTIIFIIGLIFLGCGDNSSSLNNKEQNIEVSNLPTITSNNESDEVIYQKTLAEEISMIKDSVHVLPWAYYKKGGWGISTPSEPYVFSLMPIVDGVAGWGEVSLTAGQINVNNDIITIGDIPTKTTCEYYDRGLDVVKENCSIKSDIENFKNSTIDLVWWFFQTSDGSWYIMKEGHFTAYKFAANEEGNDYNWTKHTVDIGINPTFFVENGVKKMKFVATSSNNDLVGIDVSKHNGTVNWNVVKNDGVSFAYVKSSEGYVGNGWSENDAFDSKFIYNMDNAIANAILVGAYHRVVPDANRGTEEAKREAQ